MTMEYSVKAVERIVKYTFGKKDLLEQALTHSSAPTSSSNTCYDRLEFVGDAALRFAFSNFLYLNYPDLDNAQLSLFRDSNISTEKLAHVAVKHQLYKYIKHNEPDVIKKMVIDFVKVVVEEEDMVVHGGQMNAPQVLSDIVKSVFAAIYIDCGWDCKFMWNVIRGLLEPLDVPEKEPHPITMPFDLCNKFGKQVEIKHQKRGDRAFANVYVNRGLVASVSSDTILNAELHAAEEALSILERPNSIGHISTEYHEDTELIGAKQTLYELCNKNGWPNPSYRVEQEGPPHDRIYVSSVKVLAFERELLVLGNKRSKVKNAENVAATKMLLTLKQHGYIQ